jgi:RNA polymerase sigma-70 factor, ECF subfamily
MTAGSMLEITQLLLAWSNGDQRAFEILSPLVAQELHRLAKRYMNRERPGHTLQTTALVNEAYLRLIDVRQVKWQNRAHFFALSAQVMRRILVDFARSHLSDKRGGHVSRVVLDEKIVVSSEPEPGLIALDEALKVLESLDRRQSQVVELRFFGGLSLEETAEVLSVSVGTVRRDWTLARAWLRRELTCEDGS